MGELLHIKDFHLDILGMHRPTANVDRVWSRDVCDSRCPSVTPEGPRHHCQKMSFLQRYKKTDIPFRLGALKNLIMVLICLRASQTANFLKTLLTNGPIGTGVRQGAFKWGCHIFLCKHFAFVHVSSFHIMHPIFIFIFFVFVQPIASLYTCDHLEDFLSKTESNKPVLPLFQDLLAASLITRLPEPLSSTLTNISQILKQTVQTVQTAQTVQNNVIPITVDGRNAFANNAVVRLQGLGSPKATESWNVLTPDNVFFIELFPDSFMEITRMSTGFRVLVFGNGLYSDVFPHVQYMYQTIPFPFLIFEGIPLVDDKDKIFWIDFFRCCMEVRRYGKHDMWNKAMYKSILPLLVPWQTNFQQDHFKYVNSIYCFGSTPWRVLKAYLFFKLDANPNQFQLVLLSSATTLSKGLIKGNPSHVQELVLFGFLDLMKNILGTLSDKYAPYQRKLPYSYFIKPEHRVRFTTSDIDDNVASYLTDEGLNSDLFEIFLDNTYKEISDFHKQLEGLHDHVKPKQEFFTTLSYFNILPASHVKLKNFPSNVEFIISDYSQFSAKRFFHFDPKETIKDIPEFRLHLLSPPSSLPEFPDFSVHHLKYLALYGFPDGYKWTKDDASLPGHAFPDEAAAYEFIGDISLFAEHFRESYNTVGDPGTRRTDITFISGMMNLYLNVFKIACLIDPDLKILNIAPLLDSLANPSDKSNLFSYNEDTTDLIKTFKEKWYKVCQGSETLDNPVTLSAELDLCLTHYPSASFSPNDYDRQFPYISKKLKDSQTSNTISRENIIKSFHFREDPWEILPNISVGTELEEALNIKMNYETRMNEDYPLDKRELKTVNLLNIKNDDEFIIQAFLNISSEFLDPNMSSHTLKALTDPFRAFRLVHNFIFEVAPVFGVQLTYQRKNTRGILEILRNASELGNPRESLKMCWGHYTGNNNPLQLPSVRSENRLFKSDVIKRNVDESHYQTYFSWKLFQKEFGPFISFLTSYIVEKPSHFYQHPDILVQLNVALYSEHFFSELPRIILKNKENHVAETLIRALDGSIRTFSLQKDRLGWLTLSILRRRFIGYFQPSLIRPADLLINIEQDLGDQFFLENCLLRLLSFDYVARLHDGELASLWPSAVIYHCILLKHWNRLNNLILDRSIVFQVFQIIFMHMSKIVQPDNIDFKDALSYFVKALLPPSAKNVPIGILSVNNMGDLWFLKTITLTLGGALQINLLTGKIWYADTHGEFQSIIDPTHNTLFKELANLDLAITSRFGTFGSYDVKHICVLNSKFSFYQLTHSITKEKSLYMEEGTQVFRQEKVEKLRLLFDYRFSSKKERFFVWASLKDGHWKIIKLDTDKKILSPFIELWNSVDDLKMRIMDKEFAHLDICSDKKDFKVLYGANSSLFSRFSKDHYELTLQDNPDSLCYYIFPNIAFSSAPSFTSESKRQL